VQGDVVRFFLIFHSELLKWLSRAEHGKDQQFHAKLGARRKVQGNLPESLDFAHQIARDRAVVLDYLRCAGEQILRLCASLTIPAWPLPRE
jgi:hypothetical protein